MATAIYFDLEAKSTLFELNVPTAISKWRDITYTLLVGAFSYLSSRREGNLKGIAMKHLGSLPNSIL
jgi:hypothetical protein